MLIVLQIVKENNRTLRVFVILRGKRVSQPFNVTYETEDVSAVAGKDYRNVENGVLHFSGNEHEKYIDIAIVDDQMEEKDETFNVLLTGTDHPGQSDPLPSCRPCCTSPCSLQK